MSEIATFLCSICNEPSLEICVYCTKDACPNHRCERCLRCSDCCECEVPLTGPEIVRPESALNGHVHGAEPLIFAEPLPEPVSAEEPEPEALDEPE